MGTVRAEDPAGVQTRLRARAIASEVYKKNPDHPGAAHAFAHLSATRHVAGSRRIERGVLGGVGKMGEAKESAHQSTRLPQLILADVRLSATRPVRQGGRTARRDAEEPCRLSQR